MNMRIFLFGILAVPGCCLLVAPARSQEPKGLIARKEEERIVVGRVGQAEPILVQVLKKDFRPYLHPIAAPDGKGILTEFSPGHHKHQTGLYVGHTRINGKDYFHNPGNGYFVRNRLDEPKADGKRATWSFAYELNGKALPALVETQTWTLEDRGAAFVLDLEWTAEAIEDATVGKYDYGGVFLRMPHKGQGKAVTSEGLENGKAEGKRAKWIDVGMPIEGRSADDWGHIAVLDHPANPDHPVPWRVDGQLGISPTRARLGDWKIAKGEKTIARYRFLIYTGAFDAAKIDAIFREQTSKRRTSASDEPPRGP